jgi:hypothetical protein
MTAIWFFLLEIDISKLVFLSLGWTSVWWRVTLQTCFGLMFWTFFSPSFITVANHFHILVLSAVCNQFICFFFFPFK